MTLQQLGLFLVGMMGILGGSLNIVFSEFGSRATRFMLAAYHYPNFFVSIFSVRLIRRSGMFGVLVGLSLWVMAWFA